MNQFNNFQDNEQALAKPYAALESSSTSPSIGLLITSHNHHDDHWKDISSYSQHSCNHLLEPQSNTTNSYCCARSSSKTNVTFCISSMLTFSIVIVVCLLTLFHFALSFLTTQQEHFHKSQSISSSNAVCGVTCVHGDCIVDLINGDFCSCHPGYTQDACDNVLFDFDSDQALLSTVASELVTLNPTNCFDVFKDYNPAFGLDYDCYSRNSKFYVQLGPEHLVFPKYFNTSGSVKIRINALPRQTPQTILEVVPMVGVGALVRTSKSYRFSPNAQLSYKFFTQDTSSSEFVKNINTPNFVLAPDSVKSTTVTFSVNITQRGLVWNTTTSSTEFNTGYSPPNFLYTTNEFTCNGVNCFLEAFLTGPKNAFTTTFSFDGSIANSLSGYQLIKLSSSMVPSSVKTGSILTIGATSLSEKPIPERNVNVSFADISVIISSFYVLTGGGVTQSISGGNVMIAVTSTDSVNYPLSLISNLAVTWQCNGPTGSNCGLVSQGLSASIANANLKIGNYVISVTIGGFTTLTTNVQIVDSAPLPVTLSPIPPFTSKGSSIKFSAVIYVTTSLSISFNIFQNNVKLSDAPIYLATQEKSSYYVTGEFPTTNTIPYSPLQITMYLNGNSFNFTTTTIMPKPLRFGTCFVYPDAGTIYAYETVLTLTCTSTIPEKDVKSVTIDIVDSSKELMYSVSSTKQTSVMTRIAVGNMRVAFTQTDLYGGVVTKTIPIVGTFPASVSPGSSTLQQCVQYISEKISPSNETTNIHTANNYAILLNMCVSGSFVVSSSPFDYGMINTTLVNIFSTISYMRTNVFHSSVNDLAAEYLTPLVVQVVAFCKKLNIYNTLLQTYGNILATHVKFILQNIKSSRISKNNLQALQQLLLDIYSQKLMIGSSGNNQQLSIITSQILDFVKVMTRSWEIQSISTDGEYSSNALTAKIFTVPNIAEFSGRTFSLFGNSTMTFPKSGLTDAFSTSRYRVLTSVYDFSNIFSNLLPTNSVPFIQSIYTLDVKRSNDDTILDVNNLPQPIQLTFNISSNNLNSTLLQLYSEKKANIVCRYFLESNSVWINDSTITTSVQSLVMTQSVPTFNATLNSTVMINSTTTNYVITCSTNHLTSFAVFADIYPPFINASTNSTNTTNIDPNNPRVVTPTGLGGGEIAAIVVSILAVCVLAPLAILVFAALGFYLLKRKQKSKATTNSHVAATSEALVMKELEPKSHLQESSSALFISEYRSMKGGTAMNDFTSQSSVTSSPTTSTIVTQNILGKKYEIIEKIGAGAFGAVFKASNLSYSGKSSESPFVAVKKIQLSGLSELNEKFKEAVAMFKTKHDHLVSLQDALIDEASMSLFLVMKYYAHGDLDQFIKDKKHLPEKVLKQIIVQVCQGLKYLEQERDMLHRDVKPSNIFIESFDTKKNKIQVVLSDFGLARESTMLQSMSFAGTPFFMSPQMLIGSKYSFNADIFSLGCSIFGLATFDLTVSLAQLYFQKMPNVEEVKQYVTEKIKQCGEKYSDGFIKALLAMLEFDAEKRPNAAQVLAMDFFKNTQ